MSVQPLVTGQSSGWDLDDFSLSASEKALFIRETSSCTSAHETYGGNTKSPNDYPPKHEFQQPRAIDNRKCEHDGRDDHEGDFRSIIGFIPNSEKMNSLAEAEIDNSGRMLDNKQSLKGYLEDLRNFSRQSEEGTTILDGLENEKNMSLSDMGDTHTMEQHERDNDRNLICGKIPERGSGGDNLNSCEKIGNANIHELLKQVQQEGNISMKTLWGEIDHKILRDRKELPAQNDENKNLANIVGENSGKGVNLINKNSHKSPEKVAEKHSRLMENFHESKLISERLASENSNLKERLSVAEARASHCAEVDALLQEADQTIVTLEKQIDVMQKKSDERIEILREGKRKEIERWEAKELEMKVRAEKMEQEKASTVEDVEAKIRERDSTISSLWESLDVAERDLDLVKRKKKTEIREEKSRLEASERETVSRIQDLEGDLNAQTEQVITLTESRAGLQDELKLVQEENHRLSDRSAKQDEQIKSTQEHNHTLAEQNVALKKDLDSISSEMHDLKASFESSKAAMIRLEEEKNLIHDQSISSFDAVRGELTETLRSKERFESEMREQVEALQQSKQQTVEELKWQLEDRDQIIASLEKSSDSQSKEIASLRLDIRDTTEHMDKQLQICKENLKTSQDESDFRGGQTLKLQEDIGKLQVANKSITQINDTLNDEIDSLVKELDNMKVSLKDTEAVIRKLEKEKAHIQGDSLALQHALKSELSESKKSRSRIDSEFTAKIQTLEESKRVIAEKLSKKTVIIESLENMTAAQKGTISSLRLEMSQLAKRMESQVQNSKDEQEILREESQALSEQISEQATIMQDYEDKHSEEKRINQMLSTEVTKLKNADGGKLCRIDQLEILLQESEAVVSQLEQELAAVREKNQESMQTLQRDLSEKAKKEGSKIKKLEKKVKEYHETLMTQEKALSHQKESMSSYRVEMQRLVSSLEEAHEKLKGELAVCGKKKQMLEQDITASNLRISDQEKDLQMLMKDIEKAKVSNGTLRDQVANFRERLFKAHELAANASSLETSLENLKREKTESEEKHNLKVEDLNRQLQDALKRRVKMEKELKQNTALLMKIKNKLVKSSGGDSM